jgi:hypothetical protein
MYTAFLRLFRILTLIVATVAPQVAGAAITDADLLEGIATAMGQPNYEESALELSTILDNVGTAGITDVAPETSTAFYNALVSLYNKRVDKYQSQLSSDELSIDTFQILLSVAVDSPLLATTAQRTTISQYQDTILLEQYIFDIPREQNYKIALDRISSVFTSARGKTVIPIVQDIFFNNLTTIFNRRINAQGTALVDASLITLLTKHLSTAQTSTLVADASKITIRNYLATLTLEVQINGLRSIPDLMNRWTGIRAITPPTGAGIISPITQAIFNNVIQGTITAMLNAQPLVVDGTNGTMLSSAITVLKGLTNSPFLPIAGQTALPNQISQIQNAIFAVLQNRYNTNNTSKDVTILTSLKTTLETWLTLNTLTTSHNQQIALWLQSLNTAISTANLLIPLATLSLNPTVDGMANLLSTLLNARPPIVLDTTTQDQIFNALKKLFDGQAAINEIPPLQALVILFTNWANSNLLKVDQTATIKTNWIPTINAHIAQLTFRAGIPTTPSGNLPAIPAAGSVTLTAADQNAIFAALQYRYDNRSKLQQALLDLQALLTSWLNSKLLTTDQNNTIQNAWLIQIAKELAYLKSLLSIGIDPITGSSMGSLPTTVTPTNFPIPTAGITLPSSLLDALIAQLQALINARNSTDQNAINQLKNLINQLLANGGLNANQQTTINNAGIALDKDLALINLNNQLATGSKLTGQALVDWLNNLLNGNLVSPLDAATQQRIFDMLKRAYDGRTQTIASLGSVKDLLGRWRQSNLLSPDQNNTINNTWLPTITTELTTLQLLQAIASALAQADYATRLASLKAVISTAQVIAQVPVAVQTAYYNALTTVYSQRQMTINATLAQLADLLTNALSSNLLNTTPQKTAIQELLNSLNIVIRINSLLETTDYKTCLDGHQQLLNDVQTQTFIAAIQNMYAQALMQLFNQRASKTLPMFQQLALILKAAQTTPLLAKAQQDFIQKLIDTLTIEIMITTALNQPDYGAQLDGLLDMIFIYQYTPGVEIQTQNLFFEAIKIIFVRRISQFDITNDSNLDKLHLLLLNSEDCTLLSAQQQPIASAYGDMVVFEQMVLDARQIIVYADKIANMIRILSGAPGRAFDPAGQELTFNLLQTIYNDRTYNRDQVSQLIALLQLAASSPMLNFNQQKEVRLWLAALGITITSSPIDQNISNALTQPDTQAKINALLQISTQTPAASINPSVQGSFNAALQEILGLLGQTGGNTLQNNQNIIDLLKRLKDSPLLSTADRAYINSVLLPSLQPTQAATGTAAATSGGSVAVPPAPTTGGASTGTVTPGTGGASTGTTTPVIVINPKTAPTAANITAAATTSKTNFAQGAITIANILNNAVASGKPLTAAAQTQLAQVIAQYQKDVAAGKGDPVILAQLQKALTAAVAAGAITGKVATAATNLAKQTSTVTTSKVSPLPANIPSATPTVPGYKPSSNPTAQIGRA